MTDTIQHLKPISDCQIYEFCLNHTGTRHYITIPCSQYKNRKHSILHLSAPCSFSCFPIKKKTFMRGQSNKHSNQIWFQLFQ